MVEPSVEVSIVMPAHNEEAAIGKVIDDVRSAMEGDPRRRSYEILIVDDASTDRTAEIAREHGAIVISHRENQGSGASRKTGILKARGEIIVMNDADDTYPAAAIPQMLDYFPDCDQVIGARKSEKGTLRPLRWMAKGFIKRLAEFLVGKPIPDLNSGLRAFKKTVMVNYLYLLPEGFSCVSTMSLAFLANKYRVAYLPIDYFPRIGKSKFHPFHDTYRYMLTVVRITTYFNPLRMFLPLSLFLVALGFIKGIVDFVWTGTLQESDIIAILAGLVVAAIGMLADLIVLHGKKDHVPRA